LVALLLDLLGAPEIAVIELSVGAGLVTVLFVFAINIAGEEIHLDQSLIPKPVAFTLVGLAVFLSAFLIFGPQLSRAITGALPGFAEVIWKDRVLDVVLQVVLIFAGVLGVLGLLSEAKNPSKEVGNEH
jgi:NADH:ubiquinone oxidoreductase subunit 6 (subunit J)